MAHVPLIHFSTHRKELSTLDSTSLTRLRHLIDTYIITRNPVGEHAAAAAPGSPFMIHDMGFLAWHTVFVAELENWLVVNGGQDFVPLPYFDPAKAIPAALNKSNSNPNFPVPDSLRPGGITSHSDYMELNDVAVTYHNNAHGRFGGQMPFPQTSPSDPIFWPFHALFVAVYEHWRSH